MPPTYSSHRDNLGANQKACTTQEHLTGQDRKIATVLHGHRLYYNFFSLIMLSPNRPACRFLTLSSAMVEL